MQQFIRLVLITLIISYMFLTDSMADSYQKKVVIEAPGQLKDTLYVKINYYFVKLFKDSVESVIESSDIKTGEIKGTYVFSHIQSYTTKISDIPVHYKVHYKIKQNLSVNIKDYEVTIIFSDPYYRIIGDEDDYAPIIAQDGINIIKSEWNRLTESISNYLNIEPISIKEQEKGTFIDNSDNHVYKTVKIGYQIWMAENLNYSGYNGRGWCYEDDTSNCRIYGRLYNWEMAKNVCPSGWRLPTKLDFEILMEIVGGKGTPAYKAFIRRDSTSFSVIYGGLRTGSGKYEDLYLGANFWSASEHDLTDFAYGLCINAPTPKEAVLGGSHKSLGYSVRCIKD